MMNRMRQVAFGITCAIAVLAFAACSNRGDGASAHDGAGNGPSSAASRESTPESSAGDNGQWEQLVGSYRDYVVGEIDALVTATGEFTAAIKSGDFWHARNLYAPTRMHYERIEPVAEALGNLDPEIDAREGDVPADDWSGFHRIEKGLWSSSRADDLGAVAEKLQRDVTLLRAKVETIELDPNMLVVGAVDLLNEVATSKVTGEEDRYSHTDLYDFAANIEGAAEIFALLKPAAQSRNPQIAATVEQRFADLQDELSKYEKDGAYASYTTLTNAQTRALAQKVDALADPFAQLASVLAEAQS